MFEKFVLTGNRHDDEHMLLEQLSSLLEPSNGSFITRISSLANACALLAMYLERVNWVGFYLRDSNTVDSGDVLVLGPFQGAPACVRIPIGKGVCGTACATGATQLVPDVHAFPGHIACDGASQSEIVVPIKIDGRVVAVLDVDSPDRDRFSLEDAAFLEQVVARICLTW